MNVFFDFTVKEESLSVEAGYERLTQFLAAIQEFLPIPEWYVSPESEEESKGRLVAVSDTVRFLARARHEMAEEIKRLSKIAALSGFPVGFEVWLTSAKDEEAFQLKEGLSTLRFEPENGRIQLEIGDPDLAWPNKLTERMKSVLNAVAHLNPKFIEFASLDVSEGPTKVGKRDYEIYSQTFRTFPHRQFLGWMGFVPKVLKPQDIPEAAEIIPLPERHGSIVVAVGETFDLRNPQHIKQAQQVEMRLVDLDALPVIDPDFQEDKEVRGEEVNLEQSTPPLLRDEAICLECLLEAASYASPLLER